MMIGNSTATTALSNQYNISPFLGSELLALTLSAIIAVLLTFAVQYYLSCPKIRGGIFGVLISEWTDVGAGIHKTSFWPCVYLTNQHRNTIWALDYEFEADFGEGYVKLQREYFDVSKSLPSTMTFYGEDDKAIQIPNLGRHLLTKIAKPIRYGDFLHGFVMFSGDIKFHEQRKPVKKAKFTCIDVFRKRHTIEVEENHFLDINLLLELLQVSAE
jgi:hypothetical protein